ncbi:MAG: addiction module protein [Planctomycetota bacterium]
MSIDLPLENMSVAEKLRVLEMVWASLCQQRADVASPERHAKVLAERTRRLAAGEATVSKWSDAKQRLQDVGR